MDGNSRMVEVRNQSLLPDLSGEGTFEKGIVLATLEKHNVPVGSRLFSHHTLSSIRKLSFYKPFGAPNDKLDLSLTSTYNHTTEFFPDEVDLHIQPETRGCATWRKIRNTVAKPMIADLLRKQKILKRGGITERKSPFSVKLMNSGVHSSQTNPGFSRQPAGGAIFFY